MFGIAPNGPVTSCLLILGIRGRGRFFHWELKTGKRDGLQIRPFPCDPRQSVSGPCEDQPIRVALYQKRSRDRGPGVSP